MMTRLTILFALLLSAPTLAADLRTFDDAPGLYLMDGMDEAADESLTFDKPEGRIVTAIAYGAVTKADVLHYYQDLLPQLGWAATGFGTYEREGESLSLSVSNAENALTRLEIVIEPVQQTP